MRAALCALCWCALVWAAGADLVIDVPARTFVVGDLLVTLNHTQCSDFQLGSLVSGLMDDAATNAMFVDVVDIGAVCNGSWAYEDIKHGAEHGAGRFAAAIAPPSTLNATISLGAEVPPRAAVLADCASIVHVAELQWSGSGLAPMVLQLLSDLFRAQISAAASKGLCVEAERFVAQNVSALVFDLGLALDGCPASGLAPSAYPLPAGTAGGLVDFQGSAVLALVDFALDSVVGPEGEIGLDTIFALLTNNTGALNTSSLALRVPLNTSGGTLWLSVDSVRIAGLDQWDQFDVLRPDGPYVLGSSLQTARLDFAATVSVDDGEHVGVFAL